jgi:hypothetical protein
MKKHAALCGLIVLFLTHAHAAAGQRPVSEFPPQDVQLQMLRDDGLARKVARRQAAQAPDDPETLRLMLPYADQMREDILRVLERIVDTRPDRIPEALGPSIDTWRDFDASLPDGSGQRLRAIATEARTRASALSKEQEARAERVLMDLLQPPPPTWEDYTARLRTFVERYRGTTAALETEVDAINATQDEKARERQLNGFVAAHPGTAVAARALFSKGSMLRVGPAAEGRSGGAPAEQFFRVAAIVRELENGGYPACKWVEKAPSLLMDFYIPDEPAVPSADATRIADAYVELTRTHFARDVLFEANDAIGYVLTSKIAGLYGHTEEGDAAVERALSSLEQAGFDPASLRYLKAQYLLLRARDQPASSETALRTARHLLSVLSAEGASLPHRKALATLTALQFEAREYAAARESARTYVSRYPRSEWTWVAAVRAAQCDQALGENRAAAAAFIAIAEQHPDLRLATVLGHEYAARAFVHSRQRPRARRRRDPRARLPAEGWCHLRRRR